MASIQIQPNSVSQPQVADIFHYEPIDANEFARRLNVPVSWVRDRVRRRCSETIPHVRFGKYVRFLWGSPDLAAWIEQHVRASK